MSWVTRAAAAREAAAATAKAGADRKAALTDWRRSCEQVRVAYGTWCRSPRRDRATSFKAYHSALDREQITARTLERSIS